MPLYFAYGSNMDRAAMLTICPASRPLGQARLAAHRFFIMESGYASVRRSPGEMVHGVLWDLALRDVPALDRYEEVDSGLYLKRVLPVHGQGRIRAALVYIGHGTAQGWPIPGYMERVVAAANSWALPASHICQLSQWLPSGAAFGRGGCSIMRSRGSQAADPRPPRLRREI